MRCASPAAVVAFCAGLWVSNPALAQGQQSAGRPGAGCEVCKEFLSRFYNSLIARGITFSLDTIEKELINFCLDAKGKENRLCYYLGATKDAATKTLSEVTRPMSVHVPVMKMCEKLKKVDSPICELKYGIRNQIFFFQCVQYVAKGGTMLCRVRIKGREFWLGVMAHTCDPSTRQAEAGGSRKATGLGCSGSLEDESSRAETDPEQLGGRVQGMCREN